MRVLLLADLHHQEKEYFIQYQLNYLDEIKTIIRQEQVDTIIIAGDINDKQKITDNRVIQLFREKHLELRKLVKFFFVIVGNHDIFFKATNKYNSLRSFFPEDHYTIIDNESLIQDNCLLIPWVNDENRELIVKNVKNMNKKGNYLFGHLELSNFNMGSVKSKKDHLYRQDYEKYTKVFSGHYHTPQHQRNVEYIGSLTQLKKNDSKERHIIILDTETHEIKRIKNKKNIFENIYIEENLEKEDIMSKLNNIKNKIVEITINSSDTKYINKVENIIIDNEPHKFNIMCNNVEDEVDIENSDIENTIDVNEEYLNNIEYNDDNEKEEIKRKFEEYLNKSHMS